MKWINRCSLINDKINQLIYTNTFIQRCMSSKSEAHDGD